MLVLGRTIGERILLATAHGDLIAIEVEDIRGRGGAKGNGKGYVRIGIDAPLSVVIEREEVAKRRVAAAGQ